MRGSSFNMIIGKEDGDIDEIVSVAAIEPKSGVHERVIIQHDHR